MKKLLIIIFEKIFYCYIYLLLFLQKIFLTIYLYFKNIIINELYEDIFLIKYNNKINNKYIVIIHGGGLILNGNEDLLLSNLLLPKLKDYTIISLYYPINQKYSDTLNYLIEQFKKIENFNIEIFIGDSIGGTLLLDLLDKFNYKNKKLILFSPAINFNIKSNKNMYKDYLIPSLTKHYIKKYINRDNNFNLINLPKTLIIVGENELMYDDIIEFSKKINSKNIIIKNGIHIDSILFRCPENVLNEILLFIS